MLEQLKKIERAGTSGHELTDAERYTLSQWQSWGALSEVFDERNEQYAPEREKLHALLSENEYSAARRTVLTAFFTEETLTTAMWEVLQEAGYTGGSVLEPGCGKGDFLRTAPEGTTAVGIELDPTTAQIASLLNPDAQIRAENFTATKIPDATFTATIGNVPFSRVAPYDPNHNRMGLSLHNYVISKSIDLTKPGGYIATVTSTFTADATSPKAREALTERADFITGARLPSGKHGAFAANAGTEAGTDILIFRVREDGQEATERTKQFLETTTIKVGEHEFRINKFFADNSAAILGAPVATTGRFGPQLGIERDTATELVEQVRSHLIAEVSQAVQDGYGLTADTRVVAEVDTAGLIDTAAHEAQEVLGTVRYEKSAEGVRFEQLQSGPDRILTWMPVAPAKKYEDQWAQIIDMRDTTTALLTACRDHKPDDIHALRTLLNVQYDQYTLTYGPINLHETQKPRTPTQKQIDAAFSKLESAWRRDNAINDRPFEGDLPTEVVDELLDRAQQPTGSVKSVRRHLKGALEADPFLIALRAAEDYNEETRIGSKGALFFSNPIRAVSEPATAETVPDALTIIEHSAKDLTTHHIAALLPGRTPAEVERELVDNKLAFRAPTNPDIWIPATQYLAGNVRAKLRQAEDLADRNALYSINRDALAEVQPPKITEGIVMNLGATWVPKEIYIDFIAETLEIPDDRRNEILIVHASDTWHVAVPDSWSNQEQANLKYGMAAANADGAYNYQAKDRRFQNMSHQGVAHKGRDAVVYSAAEALQDAMNKKAPALNYSLEARYRLEVPNPEGQTVLNPEATRFAGRKVTDMNERFQPWAVSSPERLTKLIDAYNDRFNNIVAPAYDGSKRELPGLSENFNPYPYQRNAVERMVNEPSVLLNHVVGAGKTGSMIIGAMELKRLELCAKPALVVPNHLVDQIAREANQWYPGARVLSGASALGNGPDKRRMFIAQATTGAWDLVVIPESVFKQMAVSPEVEVDYLRRKVDELRDDLEAMRQAPNKAFSGSVKNIEQTIERHEEKIAAKLDKVGTDVGITFDHTGIDYLIVDEAHGYKNLQRFSPTPELGHAGSDKALDMDMKLEWLRESKPMGAPVVTFATGTPITNSISEMWVMLHYLRPDIVQEAQVTGVNAWGNNFTESVTDLDFSAGGKIRERPRISRYINTPELARMSAPFMDFVSREQIPAKLPALNGGKPTTIEFDPGTEVKDFNRDLMWREEHLGGLDARIDGPLKIIGDGKKATLDPRMANLDYDPNVGRVKALTDQVFQVWETNRDNVYTDIHGEESPNLGALQIIFCDRGVPSSDPNKFTMYDAIRDELVAQGMDRNRIRFIHEWDKDKLQLFDDCNNGRVDVVIGNTEKLSTGANIQARAVALHHVDVPWRPADLQQREGRIIRQGNQNSNVDIFTYVGKGTSDAFAWNTIERKAGFIEQLYRANQEMRSMEPLEDPGTSALAHNKAIATGNMDFVLEMRLNNEIQDLESKKTEHDSLRKSNILELKVSEERLPQLLKTQNQLETLAPLAKKWDSTPKEHRTWTFGGRKYSDRKEATLGMTTELAKVAREHRRDQNPTVIGEVAGIPISAKYSYQEAGLFLTAPGTMHAEPVPEKMVREDLASSREPQDQKNLAQIRSGYLMRIEAMPAAILRKVDRNKQYISETRVAIDRLKTGPSIGTFPDDETLSQKKKELAEVHARLAAFNSSAAESLAIREHQQRLAAKGRSAGYSLELNPTRHMVAEGIPHHPQSKPIAPVAHSEADHASLWSDSIFDAEITIPTKTPTSAMNMSLVEGLICDELHSRHVVDTEASSDQEILEHVHAERKEPELN